MIRGLAKSLGVLAAFAVASGCAPAPPAPPATDEGPSVVSLNPCLDAIVVEVAAPERILAISHFSHQPGGSRMDPGVAAGFASTGGTAEEIIALGPDIVLASVFVPRATRAALERAGLRVETFDSPKTVKQSAAQIERLAALVGSHQRATDASAAMLSPPVSALLPDRADARSGPDPSVLLWQAGQIVAGQETLIAQLIKEAGFTSHSEALGLGQGDYVTLEQVLSDPPDLLLVAGDSLGQQHPALSQIEGTRVHFFDPSLFYCGGPSIADAREELRRLRLSFDEAAR